jgi:benzoate-CoA ligase family protein
MNLFDAIFNKNRHGCAIMFGQAEISYDDLRLRTLRMRDTLAVLGVQPGDRVGLLLNDSPEFITAFIATCSMGAIVVPVNMALRPEDRCSILHSSGARFALIEPDLRHLFLTDAFESLQELKSIVIVDRNTPDTRFEELQRRPVQKTDPDKATHKTPSPTDAAFILYTSGSTGEPKGAVHSQAGIFATLDGFCEQVLKLTPNDRLFSSSRLPFAYGLGNSFSFPLLNGATSILCAEKPTAQVIFEIFGKHRPTIFFAVPVVYNLLLEHHNAGNELDCSSLRFCVSAGEALPAHLGQLWEDTFGIPVLDGIGSTEMLHMFMSNHYGDVRYGSSGKLLEGYEARLLDDKGNLITTANTEGHLWVKGNSAAQEYWNRPDETRETFVNGWVRTGDLYRRDEDWYWFHMGRSDDCFKSSGQWVSPVEVEGVLVRHQEVARAAVVEDFDDEKLPCACAFVVMQDVESNASRVEEELRALARASLPRFKQPRNYIFLRELPYTATGKIQRFKLRKELREQRDSERKSSHPL